MISVYEETVRDALYPKRKGIVTKKNRYLAIEPVHSMTNDEIRALRERLHLSIGMFASLLAVSEKALQAWEKGTNEPSGPALRIMNMISRYPDLIIETRVLYETGIR